MEPIDLLWFLTVVGLINCEGGVRLQVRAGSDVVLPCSLYNKDIGPAQFVWRKDGRQEVFLYDAGAHSNNGRQGQDEQFKGRVSHFPDELINGKASIIIRNTRPSDSGSYTCYFPHIQQQRFLIELLVDPVLQPRPWIEGAAPKPSVIILHQTKDWLLLQCEVRGASPKPEVVWTDGDGKILTADEPKITKTEGNKYDVVLRMTVTETDRYTCVATQKEINHENNRTTFVHVNGAASKPYATILEDKNNGILLQCEIFDASPELKVFWKNRAEESVPSKEPQRTENGGSYDIILQTTVTKTDYYRCVTTEGKLDDEIYTEIYVRGPESSVVVPVVVAAVVVGVLTAVAVGTVGFLVGRRYKFNSGGSAKGQPAERDEMLPTLNKPLMTDVEPHLVTSA